jgi:hypothetical protein
MGDKMGYSPGDFNTDIGQLHLEQKDGGRIVLWNADESKKIFEVNVENARQMIRHLRTCLHTAGEG